MVNDLVMNGEFWRFYHLYPLFSWVMAIGTSIPTPVKSMTGSPSNSPGVDAFLEILRGHETSAKAPLTNAKGAFSWSLAEYAMGGMLYFNKQRLGMSWYALVWFTALASGKARKNTGQSPFGMGESTISMAIFDVEALGKVVIDLDFMGISGGL